MSLMNDESHIDRYVRITNRERYLIVRALSVLKDAYYTMGIAYDEPECLTPGIKDVIALSRVFCEENWICERCEKAIRWLFARIDESEKEELRKVEAEEEQK